MNGQNGSRAALAKKAVRPAMPARLMISGPAGAGKTWSALSIARSLVGETGSIILIDTETDSALTYADEHSFEHLAWDPPFDPRQLAFTLRDLYNGKDTSTCLVVDSASHFWTGDGGTLDIADGKFGGWKQATPAQDEMVSAMLRATCHIIVCVREKQAYSAEKDSKGKMQIEKLGMAPIQREGLDYEFNVAVSIDTNHTMSVHKTRCRVLSDRSFRPHHEHEMAEMYADWLAGGQPMISPAVAQELKRRVMALSDEAVDGGVSVRKACIDEIKEHFGMIDDVMADDVDALSLLIAGHEAPAEGAG